MRRYFGFDARVSMTAPGRGTSAQPQLGVSVDPEQLQRLRDSLDARLFDGVVRFVMAHEWTHMGQFNRDSVGTRDSALVRVLECDADMWAGMISSMVAADSGIPAADFMAQSQVYAAAAFQLGTTGWTLPWMHPGPEERMLCATIGSTTGFDLRLVRYYERTNDVTARQQLDARRAADASAFGLGDDILVWTRRMAERIVRYRGAALDPPGGAVDFTAEIRQVAQAAQRGPDTLRARGGSLKISGAAACRLDESESAVQLRCEFSGFASGAVARGSYTSWKWLARPAMAEVDWREQPELNLPGFAMQTFVRSDRGTSASVTLNEVERTITMTFAAMKQ